MVRSQSEAIADGMLGSAWFIYRQAACVCSYRNKQNYKVIQLADS